MRLTPILITIGVVILAIVTGIMLTFSHVHAQTSGTTCVQHLKNVDLSHQFSICYKSTMYMNMTTHSPNWNMTVWTEAAPRTKQIMAVRYTFSDHFLCPHGECSTFRTTPQDQKNHFAYSVLVFAGPLIKATAYFVDRQNITQSKETETHCTSSVIVCPIEFNITPKISGFNVVEVNGSATANYGTKIAKIYIDWGDDNNETRLYDRVNTSFAFRHLYSAVAPYKIIITAFDESGFRLSQFVTTTALLLEHSFPSGSDTAISAKTNSILKVSASPDSVDLSSLTGAPINLIIYGKLSSLTRGAGIPNQTINITVFGSNKVVKGSATTDPTMANGEFSTNKINLGQLGEGIFKVVAYPENQTYVGFNATKDLTVTRAITFDQFIQYLSVASVVVGSVVGGAVKIPPYISEKKQAKMLRNCILDINDKFNKYKKKQIERDQYLNDLESLRSSFMNLVASKDIAEDQYKMLDDMISSYSNRAHQQEST